jgi:hypothetical protein
VRAEIAAAGTPCDGYHLRMEQVHRDNAAQLRALIERFGWPHERIAGRDGARAAWLIAQHAISEPGFMRRCRGLLEEQAESGTVPQWQYACGPDRAGTENRSDHDQQSATLRGGDPAGQRAPAPAVPHSHASRGGARAA